jgi:hypothetical protein
MKFLFHLYKINLGIALFLLICLKPFSSVAAFTLKTIGNSHELDLDSYAITLRYVPTHSLNQKIIFSKGINQREKDNVLSFLRNSQVKKTELSETLNQFESQLLAIGKMSYQGEDVVDDANSFRSLYALPTLASVAVWQGNILRGFVVTVPLSSDALPIRDFRMPFESWSNLLLVTNNFTQEVERSKPFFSLSNNFQGLRLSDQIKNPALQPVVPILPQVAMKDIYKGIYDFDITIVDQPEQKYKFIVN